MISNGAEDTLSRFSFHNKSYEQDAYIDLFLKNVMPPSYSSQLLIENMPTVKNSSILDLCAGSGVVGICAMKYGAKRVDFLEVDESAIVTLEKNIQVNGLKEEIIQSNMFSNVKKRYDIILVNPPSTPYSDKSSLPIFYSAGIDGRKIHDIYQVQSKKYLTVGGRLIFVNSSITNLHKSTNLLNKQGFECTILAEMKVPFRNFYDIAHVLNISKDIFGAYEVINGNYFQTNYLVEAKLIN